MRIWGRTTSRGGALVGVLVFSALSHAGDSLIPTPSVPDSWPGLAGGPSRPGGAFAPPPLTSVRAWAATIDETGAAITFVAQAGLASTNAALGDMVFAVGKVSRPGGPANQPRLFAFARSTGLCTWSSEIAAVGYDSIASPTIDPQRGCVIIASGTWVVAFDALSGTELWKTELDRSIVNACPAITADLAGRNRLFITDYDGFGAAASLYCLNVDPFDAALNPFSPGDIVWRVPIGGSSGNSPAYLPRAHGGLGHVYVASIGEFGIDTGRVFAFNAEADTAPDPAWVFTNTIQAGFFGGVGLVPPLAPGEPPHVLAASYVFSGGINAANLVKLNGQSGSLEWSAPCNRSISVPISLPGGRILVSGGIQGFGTVPSLRMYQDLGSSAATLWDSALGTWNDLDQDGQLGPGEYLRLGGWTQQPAVLAFAGRYILASGVVPITQFNQPSNDLYLLDADAGPSSPSFILGHHAGAGASPALAGQSLYSIGTAGLVALGPTPATLDANADGARTIDDLYDWESLQGNRDVNADGLVNPADRAALLAGLHHAPIHSAPPGGRP